MEAYALLLAATLNAGTVLAIAALGLLINEKAGIVNLGAEGIMLCAAVAGFAAVVHSGSDGLGFAAGMAAGALLAAIFGWLVIWLGTNQYATGLALSLFGVGFSAFGRDARSSSSFCVFMVKAAVSSALPVSLVTFVPGGCRRSCASLARFTTSAMTAGIVPSSLTAASVRSSSASIAWPP